jgi:hypothetical protein
MTDVLIIEADETGRVQCLHSDLIPLQELGRLTVRRASTVEFNERTQEWEVRVPRHDSFTRLLGIETRTLFANTSRQLCLEYEQREWQTLLDAV